MENSSLGKAVDKYSQAISMHQAVGEQDKDPPQAMITQSRLEESDINWRSHRNTRNNMKI
jgi:hypothetical protein